MEEHDNWQEESGWMNDDVRVSIDGIIYKNSESRKMRRIYGVNYERTQMTKIKYIQIKDSTQRLICKTLHEHNSKVMRKLNEYESKKRIFNHIKRLMRRQVRTDESINVLNGNGCCVIDKQEVETEAESFWGKLFCTNGNAVLGVFKKMIGDGMTSVGGGQFVVSRR